MDKSWKMNFPVYCWTQCQRHIGMIWKVAWTGVKVHGILRTDLWQHGERHCGVGFSFLFLSWSEIHIYQGFPGGSEVKASACNVGDLGSIPGSGRSLEKELATHSSILAWRIPWTEEPGGLHTVHGVTKSRTRLSDFTFFHFHIYQRV